VSARDERGAGSDVESRYRQRFAASAAAFERARELFPSAVNHDGRHMAPFPLTFTHAEGGRKWDVDGHETVDLVMGHGSLLLGHGHPAVVAAVQEQLRRGTHLGGSNDLESECAEAIIGLVPSAERVRFVGSGTEATLLALRIARAATGRDVIVRFQGHFHGWHDTVLLGNRVPFDRPTSTGVPESTFHHVRVLPPNDDDAIRGALAGRDVAAVILEPGGGTQGKIPSETSWLRAVRDATRATDTVLVFDEVVTGFRSSPGGVQAAVEVTPDVTTLAKALCGGLPGGAVVGRADVMDALAFGHAGGKVAHPGTYNANPVSLAACRAVLPILSSGEPQAVAARLTERLREAWTASFVRAGVEGMAYGDDSTVHLHLGDPSPTPAARLRGAAAAAQRLRSALLLHGVDLLGPHGWLSSAHTDDQLERAARALDAALRETPPLAPSTTSPAHQLRLPQFQGVS
jgi:glutamate-1-semialdehyde 2,1-aminomutase